MAERYSKLPSELLDLTPQEFDLNVSIYLYAAGERGLDRAWEQAQMDAQKD